MKIAEIKEMTTNDLVERVEAETARKTGASGPCSPFQCRR